MTNLDSIEEIANMRSTKSMCRTSPRGMQQPEDCNAAASNPDLQAVLQETIVEVNRITALLVTYGDRLNEMHRRITTLRNAIEHRRQAPTGPEANEYRAALNQIRLDLRVQIGRELDSDEHDLNERNRLFRL